MQAILKFDLRHNQHEFDCAINGTKYYDLIFEFREKLRQIDRYQDLDDKQAELIGQIRDYFNDELIGASVADKF